MSEWVDKLPEKSLDRRAFMKLPIAERQRILAAQAEAMATYYEQDADFD